jgi:aarF domain-containing kinase
MMTEANITRLVSKLSQMRGAALKLGQFLSIQGALSSLFGSATLRYSC